MVEAPKCLSLIYGDEFSRVFSGNLITYKHALSQIRLSTNQALP
jgi:hypothetical protein